MRLAHATHVLVTDGQKRLLFRNSGDATYPQLEPVNLLEDLNPPDREQKSDRPGRTSFSMAGGTRHSAYAETDFHAQEKKVFAAETAAFLREQALQQAFEALIVVADPRTLGELRGQLDPAVKDRIVGEIAKDLVKHPTAAIEQAIIAG